MDIVLVSDTFPPLRNSGAVQLRDLSLELVNQGHSLTVILPSGCIKTPWTLEDINGVRVLRLRAPKTKDLGHFRRALGELMMPFAMIRNFLKSPLRETHWDGVVWYAPSIFFGPFTNALKKASGCRGYLIIRDIFPEWAVDMGLMGRGLPYWFFRIVANYQYSVADVIGIQSPGNAVYFEQWRKSKGKRLEVLQNWVGNSSTEECSIDVSKTALAGRKIFVYAGNMGVAQSVDIFLELAEKISGRKDIGFLFVGRGTDATRLASQAQIRGLENVLFYDEIHPDEIPALYTQCDVGLVALHHNHRTHNIPGKFLTYMKSRLPVLANINPGNDLEDMILNENVGSVVTDGKISSLINAVDDLVYLSETDKQMPLRCENLYKRLFSPEVAAGQIVNALKI